MDLPNEQLKRAAWVTTFAGLSIEAAAVLGIWGGWALTDTAPLLHERDYKSPIGWTAAAGAALIFGFSEVPIKIPGSQDIGPTLFNAYGFFGNGLTHCALALALSCLDHGPLEWQWQGAVAAVDIMVVLLLARNAIWLLGIAAAPPLWCAIGMTTSFAWGTLAFGDRPGFLAPSLVGLFLLVAGVVLVSHASVLSQESRRSMQICAAAVHDSDMVEIMGMPQLADDSQSADDGSAKGVGVASVGFTKESDELVEGRASKSGAVACDAATPTAEAVLAQGFMYAFGAGIADGSLTAFYQQLESSHKGSGNARGEGDLEVTTAFASYFASFGTTMLALSFVVTVGAHVSKRCGRDGQSTGSAQECALTRLLPGMASGAMWAGANSCSVLASHFLGMALSFPLTQTAVFFCGLIGMLVFHELSGGRAKRTFGAALAVIIAGACLLSFFGRPA